MDSDIWDQEFVVEDYMDRFWYYFSDDDHLLWRYKNVRVYHWVDCQFAVYRDQYRI